ncbi:MAG: ABC transporter ATP-binding protein [Acidobacteria bacterium]|nr:ABC transporter ATP-binding protein [Acidobacteriota bacterium]
MTTTNDDFAFVDVRELSRHYGRRRALAKVSFRCEAGTITGLLGPNGAGKSTLLSVLATTTAPSTGEVKFGSLDAAEHGAAIRARLGVLGHDLYLYPELTARENLQFFSGLYGLPADTASVDQALARAQLLERADDIVAGFSRGMRQRLALERTLLATPRLLLLDEPFTGLDDASTHLLVARIRSLRDAGAIVLLTTHDLDVIEGLLDQVIFLRDGRLRVCEPAGPGIRRRYRDLMATA